jgi:hypothetical protein
MHQETNINEHPLDIYTNYLVCMNLYTKAKDEWDEAGRKLVLSKSSVAKVKKVTTLYTSYSYIGNSCQGSCYTSIRLCRMKVGLHIFYIH